MPAPASAAENGTAAAGTHRPYRAIEPGSRSCCCPSEPVAQAIFVPGDTRSHEVEVLLCAHHLRCSASTLRSLGVAVYDRQGNPIEDTATLFGRDR
ncbi:hypothetical protein E0F15_17675 [Frankia sp. B2]|nr:hypothetical protein E0F15_17675 [Frankia sp. B2]